MSIFIQQYHINVSDSLGVSESISHRLTPYHLSVSDSFNLTESISLEILQTLLINVSEGLSLSENILNRPPFYLIENADSLNLSDVISALEDKYHIEISDSMTIAEYQALSVESAGIYNVNVNESLLLTDGLSIIVPVYSISAIENLNLSESKNIGIPSGAATVYYMIWHSPNGPVILVS